MGKEGGVRGTADATDERHGHSPTSGSSSLERGWGGGPRGDSEAWREDELPHPPHSAGSQAGKDSVIQH